MKMKTTNQLHEPDKGESYCHGVQQAALEKNKLMEGLHGVMQSKVGNSKAVKFNAIV